MYIHFHNSDEKRLKMDNRIMTKLQSGKKLSQKELESATGSV